MRKIIPLLIYALPLISNMAYAMGISTTFGRVRVDNIMVGQTYSMKNDGDVPFVIKNTSDVELNLKIDILMPKDNELIDEYEPIPDTGWVTLVKDTFVLPPEGEISTDVIISIPDDDEFAGKKYQVYIWSHTTGGAIAVGLKSKLLITIAGEN